MVTHTRNLCSAIQSAHTQQWTHTPWTHTWSSGKPVMPRRSGSSWEFGPLLKATSVVILKVERVLEIHSPHLQFLPARDSTLQHFDSESYSLTIRPQLPPMTLNNICKVTMLKVQCKGRYRLFTELLICHPFKVNILGERGSDDKF